MATELEGAVELSEQERVELRQLAELILETAISDELFNDLVELSEPILQHARSDSASDDGTWSSGSGWTSSATFKAAEEILGELLLDGNQDLEDQSYDQNLIHAAQSYDNDLGNDYLETAPPATDDELNEIMEILDERFGQNSFEREVVSLMLGESVPEFLREAREFGWLDPAAVEATVEHFTAAVPSHSKAQESLIAAIREAATSYSEGNVPSVLIETTDRETISEELAVDFEAEDEHSDDAIEDDLSTEDIESDTSDEGEWGLAEIDGEDEQDDNEAFANDHAHQHGDHHDHVHQILDDELLGTNDYDGEPTDEREITTLALIAEGVLFAELSEVLMRDLIAEAEPLIRRARARGADWWMSREATAEVAELLSVVLTGSGWPTPDSQSDQDVLTAGRTHRELLKRYALSYPLDPEPTRDERLQTGTPRDRYEILFSERGVRSENDPTQSELTAISKVITDLFGEPATPRLVEDVANLIPDESIIQARKLDDWYIGAGRAIGDTVSELLLGNIKDYGRTEELLSGLRTYRTEDLTEDEFIAHYDQSRWPAVGATVDLSIFTIIDGKLQVLLIERGNHPEKGKWALPGGFVNTDESLDQAAARELQEETAVDLSENRYLEQVKTYGYPGRDRRGFIISTLYAALIAELPEPKAGDDASKARFFPVEEVLSNDFPLAFDHDILLSDALERVRAKLEYSPIVFDFLPPGGFSLNELRGVYETVWGFAILPSDFVRRISQARDAITAIEDPNTATSLFVRGSASTFFPPLDRREVVRD